MFLVLCLTTIFTSQLQPLFIPFSSTHFTSKAMAITKPTVAVTFGEGEDSKMLSIQELSKLLQAKRDKRTPTIAPTKRTRPTPLRKRRSTCQPARSAR